MKASEILNMRDLNLHIDPSKDFDIEGIAYDSRKVKPGYIFFAIRGLKDDGNKYANDAVKNGAKLILTEEDFKNESAEVLKVKNIRKLMATVSGNYYGDPSAKIKMIGITGTNGKTTTSYLIRSILNDAGYKTGLIGT